MKVRVKLFAVAKELVGRNELEVDLHDGATVADLRAAIEEKLCELRTISRHAAWAVDGQYAGDEVRITAHSEVALIPPVSGG